MDAISSAVTTGLVVTVGRWVQGKGLEAKVVIGGGVYAIMLSALWNSNANFASKIATLTLVSALLIYMVPIAEKMGFTSKLSNKLNQPTPGTTPTRGIA